MLAAMKAARLLQVPHVLFPIDHETQFLGADVFRVTIFLTLRVCFSLYFSETDK